jgi:hypothetical protein
MTLPSISDTIIAAVIGAATAWITMLLRVRPERTKLLAEIAFLRRQSEKLALETEQMRQPTLTADREAEELRKLSLERERIALELDSLRRQRADNDRSEIVELLKAFDREVFEAPMDSEDPVAMFKALRQTRIWLQSSGALYFRDLEIASHFRQIRMLLAETEREAVARFPQIPALSLCLQDGCPIPQPRWAHREQLGRSYGDAIELMMRSRRSIMEHVRAVERKLPHVLS